VGRDVTERGRVEARGIEMRLAGEAQRRLHPPSLRHEGVDIAGLAHPASATGGDYYDHVRMPEGRLGIVVADVCGHGLGAALIMVATRAALRSCLQVPQDPDQVLDHVNATLIGDLEPNSFVTMLLASLDVGARSLTYSNAGHPSGYVLDRAGEVRHVLDSNRIPLGIMPDRLGASSRTLPLESGDIVVLLTDGILESLGADGVHFGVEATLALVRRHRAQPSARILERVLEGVHASAMGAPPEDDMTAVICKVD
jgi:sigma-B regulation protein RsbU (phosphoserine phosphatase)